jgi:hypothetical protein
VVDNGLLIRKSAVFYKNFFELRSFSTVN